MRRYGADTGSGDKPPQEKGEKEKTEEGEGVKNMKTLEKILRALRMLILSMFGVDYQMEVMWFDNYFGWSERLVEKLLELIGEESEIT